MPPPISTAKKKRVIRLYESGWKISQIRKKVRSNWSTVKGILEEANTITKKPKRKAALLAAPIIIPNGSKVMLIVDGMVVYETK